LIFIITKITHNGHSLHVTSENKRSGYYVRVTGNKDIFLTSIGKAGKYFPFWIIKHYQDKLYGDLPHFNCYTFTGNL